MGGNGIQQLRSGLTTIIYVPYLEDKLVSTLLAVSAGKSIQLPNTFKSRQPLTLPFYIVNMTYLN